MFAEVFVLTMMTNKLAIAQNIPARKNAHV